MRNVVLALPDANPERRGVLRFQAPAGLTKATLICDAGPAYEPLGTPLAPRLPAFRSTEAEQVEFRTEPGALTGGCRNFLR